MLELMLMYGAIWGALIIGAIIAEMITDEEVSKNEFCKKRTNSKAHQKK